MLIEASPYHVGCPAGSAATVHLGDVRSMHVTGSACILCALDEALINVLPKSEQSWFLSIFGQIIDFLTCLTIHVNVNHNVLNIQVASSRLAVPMKLHDYCMTRCKSAMQCFQSRLNVVELPCVRLMLW